MKTISVHQAINGRWLELIKFVIPPIPLDDDREIMQDIKELSTKIINDDNYTILQNDTSVAIINKSHGPININYIDTEKRGQVIKFHKE